MLPVHLRSKRAQMPSTAKIEEASLVRNDRTADGKVQVVGVEWLCKGSQRSAGWQTFLIVEPSDTGPVELIRARLVVRRLQPAGATIFAA
jgi:hypothetical protein